MASFYLYLQISTRGPCEIRTSGSFSLPKPKPAPSQPPLWGSVAIFCPWKTFLCHQTNLNARCTMYIITIVIQTTEHVILCKSPFQEALDNRRNKTGKYPTLSASKPFLSKTTKYTQLLFFYRLRMVKVHLKSLLCQGAEYLDKLLQDVVATCRASTNADLAT